VKAHLLPNTLIVFFSHGQFLRSSIVMNFGPIKLTSLRTERDIVFLRLAFFHRKTRFAAQHHRFLPKESLRSLPGGSLRPMLKPILFCVVNVPPRRSNASFGLFSPFAAGLSFLPQRNFSREINSPNSSPFSLSSNPYYWPVHHLSFSHQAELLPFVRSILNAFPFPPFNGDMRTISSRRDSSFFSNERLGSFLGLSSSGCDDNTPPLSLPLVGGGWREWGGFSLLIGG